MSAPGIITPVPSAFAVRREHRAFATCIVVAALIAVMFAEVFSGPGGYRDIVETFGLKASAWSWSDPADYGRMLSYAFLHAGAGHFFWNTIVLLLAGSMVEYRLGLRATSAFLLTGAVIAAASHLLLFPAEARPLIGASGAVSALLGVTFVISGDSAIGIRLPLARLRLLLTLRRMLVVWIAIQVTSLVLAYMPGQPPTGVAYWAHLTAFTTGVLGALAYRRCSAPARARAARPALVESFATGGD